MADDIVQKAKKEFPYLGSEDFDYRINSQPNKYMLESYPVGEEQRPEWSRLDKFAMEVYHPNTSSLDILGDYVSHHAIHSDPMIGMYYKRFKDSLTPEQVQQVHRMKGDENESLDQSALPAAFRGYAFKQLDDNDFKYTEGQKKMFDDMMGYLKKPRTAKSVVAEAMNNYGIK